MPIFLLVPITWCVDIGSHQNIFFSLNNYAWSDNFEFFDQKVDFWQFNFRDWLTLSQLIKLTLQFFIWFVWLYEWLNNLSFFLLILFFIKVFWFIEFSKVSFKENLRRYFGSPLSGLIGSISWFFYHVRFDNAWSNKHQVRMYVFIERIWWFLFRILKIRQLL